MSKLEELKQELKSTESAIEILKKEIAEAELEEKRENELLRKCKVCDTEFEVTHSSQWFCSTLCQNLYQRIRERISQGEMEYNLDKARRCRTCNIRLDTSDDRILFCSETCALAHAIIQTGSTTTLKNRFEILKRDNFTCSYCGRSPIKDPEVTLAVDHIIPVSQGGMTAPINLTTSCLECNLGKRDVLLEEHIVKALAMRSIKP